MNIVVVGGGTATNVIAPVFPHVASSIVYVVPISDNGGSTSEILRVLGGPAIGDARSRLVRLMPPTPLRDLLEYRLPENEEDAKRSWSAIVEGNHPRWDDIPSHLKHMYRAFIIHIASEILKRTRPGVGFRFSRASIGNLVLSGAREFFGSLDAAIEFVLRTARVSPLVAVLPALNTNFSHHIAAELEDGTIIVGQSEISHPSEPAASKIDDLDDEVVEDANVPFSHPSLSASQISFSKLVNKPLSAPIDRVFYVNPYGAEIKPRASKRVINSLKSANALILSIGSLYTSIMPVILLQGFAREAQYKTHKIVLLNGSVDRETTGKSAYTQLHSIVRACYYSMGASGAPGMTEDTNWSQFVTHLLYIEPAGPNMIAVDVGRIQTKGVKCVAVRGIGTEYDLDALTHALQEILEPMAVDPNAVPQTYPNSDY